MFRLIEGTQPSRLALPFILVAISTLAGCAGPPRGLAVPRELQDRAQLPGLDATSRTWGIGLNPDFQRDLMDSVRREREWLAASGHSGALPPAEFLALSGGGADGAFGAGLLCGWSAAGNRPTFKAVTGISTGALIAPFAFLGQEYDGPLREVYTKTATRDLLIPRGLLEALSSDAMTDNKPMWKYLAKFVDQAMIDKIAAEHRKGRVLMIGTTNLDARRAVIWNVGAIAASGHPKAVELIHTLMIASASIPAAFPPVMIDVEVDGKKYQEMHVDGGAMMQLFLYPPSLHLADATKAAGITRERRAFIIRNSRLDPDWAETQRRTLSIASRAISSLIQTQGIGDLYRTYLNAQRDSVDYNLAYIPPTFKLKAKEAFDPEYMKALFEVGYEAAKSGYRWHKTPPGYEGAVE
jgi:predicted acylesterase/phospholipase RssA